jgi:hypothetical protein
VLLAMAALRPGRAPRGPERSWPLSFAYFYADIVPLADAVADLIDGDTVILEGFTHLIPSPRAGDHPPAISAT